MAYPFLLASPVLDLDEPQKVDKIPGLKEFHIYY